MIIVDEDEPKPGFLNAAKCLKCGDVIQSRFRHEYVSCKCGDISVDGGTSYIKRSFTEAAQWQEIRTADELAAALQDAA